MTSLRHRFDKRTIEAAIEALDEIWNGLPAESQDDSGELFGSYCFVGSILEELYERAHGATRLRRRTPRQEQEARMMAGLDETKAVRQ